MLHENEEVLLHVFGGILPFKYELGVLAQHQTALACLELASQQNAELLQVSAEPSTL